MSLCICQFQAMLIHKLKEEYCHLDLDTCGVLKKSFEAESPSQMKKRKSYALNVGDETFIASSAHFNPDLFNITLPKEKSVRFMDKNQGDPDDPHDHIYLTETSRKYTKVIKSNTKDSPEFTTCVLTNSYFIEFQNASSMSRISRCR